MYNQQILNGILGKGFGLFSNQNETKNGKQLRYERIKKFLLKPHFNGFTKDDLFIMQFIKKGWGHDIAALSNMAEALTNLAVHDPKNKEYQLLLQEVLDRAIHPKVNPYRKNIENVTSFGKYGYYLEHLNIILGAYQRIIGDDHLELYKRVSQHLFDNSMSYANYHADLLPNVNMKWSADQAAIIYSLWLFDQNNKTVFCKELNQKWLKYMKEKGIHRETGLFKTEVLGTRKYSHQPRGSALSYLVHYMGRFAPKEAKIQWNLYKKQMMIRVMGKTGFREYLPDYEAAWSPDSGPIIAGIGIAATGLALNAASTIRDKKIYKALGKSMNPVYSILSKGNSLPGVNKISRIGTDLLSSSIWLNAETKIDWYR